MWSKPRNLHLRMQNQLRWLIFVVLLLYFQVYGQQWLNCGLHGHRRKRIVGGERVAIRNYPWIAELRQPFSLDFINCGAVIIHKYFVLTAAHCFKMNPNASITVTYGTDSAEFDPKNSRKAVKAIRHPNYLRTAHHDDIMLIKLEKPINFTPVVQPICLPEHKEDSMAKSAKVLGFGRTEYSSGPSSKLRAVELKLIPYQDCLNVFNTSVLYPTNICAGGEEGKDSCKGDSGSPLVLKVKLNYYIIGLVSWGVKCGVKGIPGVYIHVSAYIDWINDLIRREMVPDE